ITWTVCPRGDKATSEARPNWEESDPKEYPSMRNCIQTGFPDTISPDLGTAIRSMTVFDSGVRATGITRISFFDVLSVLAESWLPYNGRRHESKANMICIEFFFP